MPPIDWQALYAANRAVIDGRRLPDVAPRTPPVDEPELLRRLRRALPAERTVRGSADDGAAGPGRGSWERLAHPEGRRERPFFVYTPPDLPDGSAVPLVVMLHGCTQDAADLARGTRMNEAADRHGFVVAYPQQTRGDNQQACWNWFVAEQQVRYAAEPAFVAGAARTVMARTARWTIDPARVYVAGLSAGGALAVVLAATHPELFAGLAVHSGLPFAAASELTGAYAAMAGSGPDPVEGGRLAFAAMGRLARPVPTLVVHGTADATVAPSNGEGVVRQWMTTNGLAAQGAYAPAFGRPTSRGPGAVQGGLPFSRTRWADERGEVVQEYLEVQGLGHAWSGGAPDGSYTDPRGPSATDAIVAFFGLAG